MIVTESGECPRFRITICLTRRLVGMVSGVASGFRNGRD